MNTNICIVLGMHRSGTSLVSGLLHQSGIVMGTPEKFIPKPNKENPKGFFENFDFRQINDRILENSGYIVKDWNSQFTPKKVNFLKKIEMQREMRRILRQYATQYSYWGWKDPRQMLTCDRWYQALKATRLNKKLKLILVYRNPLNVASSMQKRGNVQDLSHGLDIWDLYNQNALQFLQKEQLPYFLFSFENLIQNTSIVASNLSNFLEINIRPEIYNQFIQPKLVRSQVKTVELNKLLESHKNTKKLWSKLTVLDPFTADNPIKYS